MVKKVLLHGLELYMLPQRALYIPHYSMLVISDWHIGKLGHFRKEGIFVPPMQLTDEFRRLDFLIADYNIKTVVFLGDLFHSTWNSEWEHLVQFMQERQEIHFMLTKGNHDLLAKEMLENSPLEVKEYLHLEEGIVLSHEPLVHLESYIYNIVGHIHPGYQIHGKGRQRYTFPCFVLENSVLTLPAFGKWTGLFLIDKKQENQLFIILNDTVKEVK